MKTKTIISTLLGILVIASIVYLFVGEKNNAVTTPKESSPVATQEATITPTIESKVIEINDQAAKIPQSDKIVQGLYFHGTNRCFTCNKMEGYIRDVLKESFSKETQAGLLTFDSINVEGPENSHYIQEYQLNSTSFFLSLKKKGKEEKHQNCEKIWQLAKNETMFKNYIKSEIKNFLEM